MKSDPMVAFFVSEDFTSQGVMRFNKGRETRL